MRLAATVSILLFAAAVALLLRATCARASDDGVRPSLDRAPASDLVERTLDSVPTSVPDARSSGALTGRSAAPEVEASATVVSTGPVILEGTWTGLDLGEVRRTAVHGTFVLRKFSTREDVEVAIDNGRWSVELGAEEHFDVLSVELDGRRCEPVSDVMGLAVPPDRHLDLVARWVRPVVLTVLDASTSAHLADVSVVGEAMGASWEHPGRVDPERVIVRGASSPVALPIPAYAPDRESLWVRAPGYGWGHVEVPRSVGGDFVVALHPAGRLAVTLVGAPEGVALALRLRSNADAEDWRGVRYEEWFEGRERIELDGLAAERYVVTAELGHRYRYPRILASREVDLSATPEVELSLDVSGFEPPPLATLAGTLAVPPAWELSTFDLFLELVDEPSLDGRAQRHVGKDAMQVLDAARGEHAFSVPDLQTGRWELRFNPLGTSLAVDLSPAGVDDVRLEVPPPVEVRVRVRDAAGAPVSDMRVLWMPDRTQLASGGTLNSAGQAEPGTFTFTAPRGRVEVWCMSETWTFRRQVVDLDPVVHELEVEASPACGLLLSVRDSGTLLRVDAFEPVIELQGGSERGHLVDEDATGQEQRFVVPGPGLYRVRLTAPEGYRTPEPVTLSIAPEEFVELVVDVDRR